MSVNRFYEEDEEVTLEFKLYKYFKSAAIGERKRLLVFSKEVILLPKSQYLRETIERFMKIYGKEDTHLVIDYRGVNIDRFD